jgi:hypothetical protein
MGSRRSIALLRSIAFARFNPLFNPPRDAGEEAGGGLNDLNVLNDLNFECYET